MTITYKIGPYVRGAQHWIHPALLTTFIYPLKRRCYEIDLYSDKQRSLWKSQKHTEVLPENTIMRKGGAKLPRVPPLISSTFTFTKSRTDKRTHFRWQISERGKDYPQLPHLWPIQFTNKTDQQGNIRVIFPTKSKYNLILNSPYRKTLPDTFYFPFIKYPHKPDWHTLFLRTMVLCSTTFSIVTLQL